MADRWPQLATGALIAMNGRLLEVIETEQYTQAPGWQPRVAPKHVTVRDEQTREVLVLHHATFLRGGWQVVREAPVTPSCPPAPVPSRAVEVLAWIDRAMSLPDSAYSPA